MTTEQIVLNHIKLTVSQMPPESQEAIDELAEHFRRVVKEASGVEGRLALAMVNAELNLAERK